MNPHVNGISGRLSLRPPQRESLEILARIAEIIPLSKERDLVQDLEVIKSEFPSVEDFERDFPSLCFALATGVGKTRLMGAFISYLHQAHNIRHFFVLAPNLTIYNKLIADFTPNTPKYVFQGIGEFAVRPPEIITGDTYEDGRGVRGADLFGETEAIHVNIFNISKINSEVRGGQAPRIKRLSEYIGQSYFDYLARLDDLVLLMDESHRYRASAGVRAINELKPILGLELTATPQVEAGGESVPFKNTIYSYPLSSAMADGFVKEPAVATRENFNVENYTEEQLEKLKLEDGIRIHEDTKVELEVYARQADKPIVKPFMLIVAQDTDHANQLVSRIKQDDFFDGRYKDRVITVHSKQKGEEADETVQRLLEVESPDEPTEIVVHVNMLKEGWDVTNLYTIVPLRAANSKTLVEQSIGRGLRLPYARRVGVSAVDRLTIVAHDRFQEIIDEANRPDSVIRTGVVIGRDISEERKEAVTVQPTIMQQITPEHVPEDRQAEMLFPTPSEQEVARITVDVLQEFERLPSSRDLENAEIQEQIAQRVESIYLPKQQELEGIVEKPDIKRVVREATGVFIAGSIDIPRLVVLPKGEITCGFNEFKLNLGSVNLQPVPMEILIQHLRTNERERLNKGDGIAKERRLEDYIVRNLIDFDDISYDDHAVLLYNLSGQVVEHLRSYLPDEEAVLNVLQYHQTKLAELIHAQMQGHYWERAADYEVHISKGFMTLRPANFSVVSGGHKDFRSPVADPQRIKSLVFGGFRRCLYPEQKFDSDTERRFAVLLEDEKGDLKWFKPSPGVFQIHYSSDQAYEPDFVVEAKDVKYICEPKRADEMKDEDVQAKAHAAVEWCKMASAHEAAHNGKPWKYLLIPHDAITAAATLEGLASSCALN
ncbi:MAG: DEAD/DEAH box helicase family protein [Verrucomicrobia bacterium]|nr:DEAD/DEAH box helicase family protein [Verrucomicrobiota bacterium]